MKIKKYKTIEEKFIDLLKDILEIEDRELDLKDEFRHYSEWDSFGYLELIAMMDEEFGVSIENDDFGKLITLEDLINEVKNRMENN